MARTRGGSNAPQGSDRGERGRSATPNPSQSTPSNSRNSRANQSPPAKSKTSTQAKSTQSPPTRRSPRLTKSPSQNPSQQSKSKSKSRCTESPQSSNRSKKTKSSTASRSKQASPNQSQKRKSHRPSEQNPKRQKGMYEEWPYFDEFGNPLDENGYPLPLSMSDPVYELMPPTGIPESTDAEINEEARHTEPVADQTSQNRTTEQNRTEQIEGQEETEEPEQGGVRETETDVQAEHIADEAAETDRVAPTGGDEAEIKIEDVDDDGLGDEFGFEEVNDGDAVNPGEEMNAGGNINAGDEMNAGGDEINAGEEMNVEEEINVGEDDDVQFRDDHEFPPPNVGADDDDEEVVEEPLNAEPANADDLLRLGQCFGNMEDFKLAVLKYSLRTRYDIKMYRTEALKIGAKCSDKEGKCQWRVYASYVKRIQRIRIKVYYGVHSCVRSGYTKLLKQGAIAWLFKERLRVNPRMTKREMSEEIRREYGLEVSEEKCSKAKTYLAKLRAQSHESHFAKVWDYQAEILQSNLGSTLEIETIPGPRIGSKARFNRLYMCFKAQVDAWRNSCRPIIGFDGAFLKWDIKGQLLAAVGRDGDNRIVPVAWAVVEIESDDNWLWFVRQVALSLDVNDGRNIAVISDKQQGLVKAVAELLPRAEHRQCARHILNNWKKDSHDMELERLFWKIARSYTQGEFSEHMDALKRYNPRSYDTLLRTNPATWSRAFFRNGTCCNDVLNNLCESFNRTIKSARRKPLLELLEDIRRQCMVRTQLRSELAERTMTQYTPKAHEDIERMIIGSQACTRFMATNDLHEVHAGGQSYRVNMVDRTCGCRKWDMTGIPCIHAASVIIGRRERVEDYVSCYYTTEMWRLTYKNGIKPVQGQILWPRVNKLAVLPPPWRKGTPGRPSNHARRKGVHEKAQRNPNRANQDGRVMTCSNCKGSGHNKSTCTRPRVPDPPKKGRGRPRKVTDEDAQGTQPSQAAQGTQPSQAAQGTRAAQGTQPPGLF